MLRIPIAGLSFVLATTLAGSCCLAATIDFESFLDGDAVGVNVTGLEFVNATVFTTGVSLNEFEFPPTSGTNVVVDTGGAMVITFLAPIQSFQGRFTYLTPLLLEALDNGGNPLDTASSAFSTNLGISGDAGSSANETLSVNGASIRSVRITGDPAGSSFAADDFTFELAAPTTAIPEPPAAFGASLALLIAMRLRSR